MRARARHAVGHDEGKAVLDDLRIAPDHRDAAHAAELVDDDAAGEEGARADVHVAREGDVVGQDRSVADRAFVRHVGIRHEETPGAHDGLASGPRRPMDRHALADLVAVADAQPRLGPGEAHVLWLAAEDRPFVHGVSAADRRVALDDGVGADLGPFAHLYAVLDDGVGPDLDPRAETGRAADDGGGVHVGEGIHELRAAQKGTIRGARVPTLTHLRTRPGYCRRLWHLVRGGTDAMGAFL